MKPLSKKTLEKKYAELGLSEEQVTYLRGFFCCCANLYGQVSVREAWDVFKHYEGAKYMHRSVFYAFSGIVRREEGNPLWRGFVRNTI